MKVHDYEKLLVWQKSMGLVAEIYSLTKLFPQSELYGLASQMKRASASVPSNIAEGSRRSTKKDFCHFLVFALGSASELETQIKIARKLNFCSAAESARAEELVIEVMKMFNRLIEINK